MLTRSIVIITMVYTNLFDTLRPLLMALCIRIGIHEEMLVSNSSYCVSFPVFLELLICGTLVIEG